MSGFRIPHPRKLILFGTLSLADLILTRQLVHGADGKVYESNPVAGAWLEFYGWGGLVAFKALAMLLVVGLALYISWYRPRTGGCILGFACLATGLVVVYSLHLSGLLGKHKAVTHAEEVLRAEQQSLRLDVQLQRERAYGDLLHRLVQDLMANRCRLEGAVAELAQTPKAQDPRWLELLQKNYPNATPAECLALHLGYHTLVQTASDAERRKHLAQQLEGQFRASFGNEARFQVSFTPVGGSWSGEK